MSSSDMHNLLNNIIPGAIAFAIIVGGIFWLIVDDIRRQSGRERLRLHLRLHRPAATKADAVVPPGQMSSAR